MTIEESLPPLKVKVSIFVIEVDSTTDFNEPVLVNALSPIILTEFGMTTDVILDKAKALLLISLTEESITSAPVQSFRQLGFRTAYQLYRYLHRKEKLLSQL